MKKLLPIFILPIMVGCFTASERSVTSWTIEYTAPCELSKAPRVDKSKSIETLKLVQIEVRSPYNRADIAVRRANGSLVFDAYNVFAAQPQSLFKGLVFDVLKNSGVAKSVVGANSSVKTADTIEVTVEKLELNCRKAPSRYAEVALSLRRLKNNEVVNTAMGAAAVQVENGDFGAAFSLAAVRAVEAAINSL